MTRPHPPVPRQLHRIHERELRHRHRAGAAARGAI